MLGIVISIVNAFAASKIQRTYQEDIRKSIVEAKKNFLKDTVSNVVLEISKKKTKQIEFYRTQAEEIAHTLDSYVTFKKELFLEASIEVFNRNKDFCVLIVDRQAGKIAHSSGFEVDKTGYPNIVDIDAIQSTAAVFSTIEMKGYDIIYFISPPVIDQYVKSQVYEEIHSYRFSNNAYIWVNEVIDYNGGDNYAIRRIHPNLKDTEGMYLSTSMTDIVGNYPYLTELEGVKRQGELFFNYFFQKNNSDAISEKITYAVLYKEYDWIIAMGVHLDDVKALADQSTAQGRKNINNLIFVVAGATLILIVILLIFISLLEKWYYQKSIKELNNEIYKDALTMAYNRRGAENFLKVVYENYKQENQNAAVIMLDIDNYKQINDMCGHDKGGLVLKKMTEIITHHIRSTDIFCRWGGDEFLIICSGLKEENIIAFANKLLRVVSELEFTCSNNGSKYSITISMGISSFLDTDSDFHCSIKRADQALYCSKAQGKNRITVKLNDLDEDYGKDSVICKYDINRS